LVNEYNTSQLNPFNFKKLVDVENNMLNGERLRQCSTAVQLQLTISMHLIY